MAKTTHKFVLERSTKGAGFYREVDDTGKPLRKDEDGGAFHTVYVRKAAVGDLPQTMSLELTT